MLPHAAIITQRLIRFFFHARYFDYFRHVTFRHAPLLFIDAAAPIRRCYF